MATDRRGQAMIELIAGLLALALVLAATFSFTSIILSSLKQQSTMRCEAGRAALNGFGSERVEKTGRDTIVLEPLAAEYIFGTQTFRVKEKVSIPNMGGLGL